MKVSNAEKPDFKIQLRNFLIGAALFMTSCSSNASIPPVAEPSPSPKDERTACERKFSDHVDQVITVSGKFSWGKLGPLILIEDCEIYLLSDQGYVPDDDTYSRMERKWIRVNGILRFKHYPQTPPGPRAEARAPDHFYLDPRTSTIELTEPPAKK